MQPQGTGLVNTAYFDSLTAQINGINLCADLQAVVNEVMETLQAQVNAIEAQIAALLPLITLPTDLASIITWIGHLAAPYIEAYNNFIAQLAQVLAKIAALVTAIENAAARITHCSITVPPITL